VDGFNTNSLDQVMTFFADDADRRDLGAVG
jgi:hypothetical protein